MRLFQVLPVQRRLVVVVVIILSLMAIMTRTSVKAFVVTTLPQNAIRSISMTPTAVTSRVSTFTNTRRFMMLEDDQDDEDFEYEDHDDDDDDEEEDETLPGRSLESSAPPPSSSSYREAVARNTKRTDFRIFLTQRAIQSFFFLLQSTRDPHTVKWMEDLYSVPNLSLFHGTAALNLTQWTEWDSILCDLMDRPPDVLEIQIPIGVGQGRWSPNNPYRNKEQAYIEFQVEVDPPSLVARILSVREQLSKEWTHDLQTLNLANDKILESYYENHAKTRNDEEECETQEDIDPDDCVKTEHMTAAYSDVPAKKAYDRIAMFMMTTSIDSNGLGSSSHREGNFDLLSLLSTQESIHRVLREYRESGEERKVSFEWLRDFYVKRVSDFFDGNQPYHRADDFLEELMLTAPSLKTVEDSVELIDPLRVAEDIIVARSKVISEWRDIASTIPEEHIDLRKRYLTHRMKGGVEENKTKDNSKPSSNTAKKQEETADTQQSNGEFE